MTPQHERHIRRMMAFFKTMREARPLTARDVPQQHDDDDPQIERLRADRPLNFNDEDDDDYDD